MKVTFLSVAISVAMTAFASSAMAVLPTVALDPADPTNTGAVQTTSRMVFAPAMPVVINTVTSLPPMTGNVGATPTLPIATSANASTSQVQKRLLASVVGRDTTGSEVLSPVTASTQLTAGNIIEYHGYIINRSPDRVRNLKVTFDLPANTELTGLADMSPSRAYGSIDGRNFQYMPLKANIGGVVQEIPMSSYKAIQWDVAGLGLDEVAEVKYRVRVK